MKNFKKSWKNETEKMVIEKAQEKSSENHGKKMTGKGGNVKMAD